MIKLEAKKNSVKIIVVGDSKNGDITWNNLIADQQEARRVN